MRVLIACARSGIDRDAFIARGYDAIQCDTLEAEAEHPGPSIRGDVLDLLYRPDGTPSAYSYTVDLMVAHPPCTYLANSGVRWLYGGKGTTVDPVRWARMEESARLFRLLLHHPVIPHIAVENPVMHGHGQRLVGRGPDQSIQPWQHGHGETKASCYWLKNLPPLVPTDVVPGRVPRVHHASPGPDRWMERSRALPGISAAMAEQWGDYVACLQSPDQRDIA